MTRITCGVQPLIPTLKMNGTDSSTSKPSSSRSGTAITIDDIRLVCTGGKSWLFLCIFLFTCTHWRQCKVSSSTIGSWGQVCWHGEKNTNFFFHWLESLVAVIIQIFHLWVSFGSIWKCECWSYGSTSSWYCAEFTLKEKIRTTPRRRCPDSRSARGTAGFSISSAVT